MRGSKFTFGSAAGGSILLGMLVSAALWAVSEQHRRATA